MGEFPSTSILGSVNLVSQDRDGVRIDAPHGWEIHDVHHQWNKNKTLHIETGMVFHVTSGQVFHSNLNTAEVHTTANVLTMHFDVTPLNVHLRPAFIGIDVHMELSQFRKHVNVHGGHHHLLVKNFHQTSQAVHITSTKKPLSGWDKAADVMAKSPGHRGTMTLEADGEMTLESNEEIKLAALRLGESGASAGVVIQETGLASFFAKELLSLVGEERTLVKGGSSEVTIENGEIKVKSGAASVTLSNGNLTTSATETKLNGKVTLGNPATSNIASKASVRVLRNSVVSDNANVLDEITELKARLSALGG